VNPPSDQLRLIGRIPRRLMRACLTAAECTGITPVILFRTGQRQLVAVGERMDRMLFFSWPGNRISRLSWSLDPSCFSRRRKAETWRAVTDLLADCETPIRVWKPRGKIDPSVS
jgi:hypothetical protein